jgi:hypothetical protein
MRSGQREMILSFLVNDTILMKAFREKNKRNKIRVLLLQSRRQRTSVLRQ